MDEKKCGTWIRLNSEIMEWKCSICGFVRPDSLLMKTCDCCGTPMYLGEPQNKKVLDEKTVKAIESVLAKGDRVEVVPGPNGSVKVLHIKRKIVNTGQERDCPKC